MITAKNIFNKYSKSGPVDTTGANSVLFTNKGTATVNINNVFPLAAGESLSLSQVTPEIIDTTNYTVFFETDPEPTAVYSLIVTKTVISKLIC